jgi:hypothetical protein
MGRFSQERDALWRSVIDVKYGSVRVFITGGGVLWCECLEVSSKGVGYYCQVLAFRGGWSHIRFWHDL